MQGVPGAIVQWQSAYKTLSSISITKRREWNLVWNGKRLLFWV